MPRFLRKRRLLSAMVISLTFFTLSRGPTPATCATFIPGALGRSALVAATFRLHLRPKRSATVRALLRRRKTLEGLRRAYERHQQLLVIGSRLTKRRQRPADSLAI